MSKTNAEFNTAKRLIDLDRQYHVTTLRKRGLSERKIPIALADIGCINKDTGQPWSDTTIHRDIIAIERLWQRECAVNIDKHKARMFARLDEIYERAWEIEDLERALKAIAQQRELLGTDAPRQIKSEFTGKDGAPLNPPGRPFDLTQFTNDELDVLEKLLRRTPDTGPDSGGEGTP